MIPMVSLNEDRRSKKKHFETEGELCDYFSSIAKANGWKVFPEVDGWDLVLFDGEVQIGVEAKLRSNIQLLGQVMRRTRTLTGYKQYGSCPDYRAVLVPKITAGIVDVCFHLRIVLFTSGTRFIQLNPLFNLKTKKHLVLPSVPLQSGGGRPSPKVLSQWREKSLRLCIRLRRDGFVTGKDFDELGLHRQNWVKSWLDRDGKVGRHARYVLRPGVTLPDDGYERERDMIAEVDKNRKEMGL